MKNRFEALIFDMDGVIVDSEPRHERAFREVFEELGYAQSHGIHFPNYYGKSDQAVWEDFIEKHQPEQSFEELMERKQSRFLEILREDQPIFEGLPELLEHVAPYYPLGLASGSLHPVIDEVLELRQMRRFFPVVVSVQDVARGKPEPDIFLRAAELLRVAPSKCCVIEDSAAGVTAAVAAGMTVVAITNTLMPDQLKHAHEVVATYEAIEEYLLGKQSR